MVELRAGSAQNDHIGIVGEGFDKIDPCHVGGDVAVVQQITPSARMLGDHVIGGQHRRGDHLVGGHRQPRGAEQLGDLHTGPRRGVGQETSANVVVLERLESLRGAVDRLPRGHQDPVDIEEHSADGHGAIFPRRCRHRTSRACRGTQLGENPACGTRSAFGQ
ncbi:Uncharacterised protein [Mycobacteroides abscessus subsp. massiliense]|nr:Uncharacterised protein [Mycobacteroides abscessus subsp. massiliense]